MNNEMSDMKRYPEPNFSAQNAWKSMQEILDKEMPVNDKRKKRFIFFWLIALLCGGISIYLLSNSNSKNNVVAINENTSAEHNKVVGKKIADVSKNVIENGTKSIAIDQQENNNKIASNASNTTTKNSTNNKTNYTSKTTSTKSNFNKIFTNKTNSENYSISTPEVNILKQIADVYYGRISQKQNPGLAIKSGNLSNNNIAKITSEETKTTSIETVKAIDENKNITVANTVVKVPKNKLKNSLHYGLQWNILLPQTNSYLDYKAKNQPFSVAIPEFWISKDLSRKSELALQLNPYSQYTVRNNNALVAEDYPVTIYQGSNPIPTVVHYTRTRSLLKAMGLELTAKYTYHINDKFSVAVGIGNNWLNAAVVNEKIVSKDGKYSKDSVYGIAKGFNDWNYIKSSFAVGRIEMLYQFKKLEVGVAFLKPLSNIYSFSNTSSSPINGRVVLRWKIK